jgi:hypothetical protein
MGWIKVPDASVLTVKRVRELFYYEPELGVLIRRVPESWENYPGLTIRSENVHVVGVAYKTHRLIWLHYYGVWPVNRVVHINGDPKDNRISNLKEANPNDPARIFHPQGDRDSTTELKIIEFGEAKALGLKYYFTGKPCPYGHIAQKDINSKRCVICERLRARKRVQAGPTVGRPRAEAASILLEKAETLQNGCMISPYISMRTIENNGSHESAHRIVFGVIKGLMGTRPYVSHLCNNGHCINPDHLVQETPSDARRRAEKKKREATRGIQRVDGICPGTQVAYTINNGCWIPHLKPSNGKGGGPGGYCNIRDPDQSRAQKRLHRHVYETVKGPIPKGMVIRHLCHNRACCNPDHLRRGTNKQNNQDTIKDGRHPFVDSSGKLRPEISKLRDQTPVRHNLKRKADKMGTPFLPGLEP